jgi:hypothetical protein
MVHPPQPRSPGTPPNVWGSITSGLEGPPLPTFSVWILCAPPDLFLFLGHFCFFPSILWCPSHPGWGLPHCPPSRSESSAPPPPPGPASAEAPPEHPTTDTSDALKHKPRVQDLDSGWVSLSVPRADSLMPNLVGEVSQGHTISPWNSATSGDNHLNDSRIVKGRDLRITKSTKRQRAGGSPGSGAGPGS